MRKNKEISEEKELSIFKRTKYAEEANARKFDAVIQNKDQWNSHVNSWQLQQNHTQWHHHCELLKAKDIEIMSLNNYLYIANEKNKDILELQNMVHDAKAEITKKENIVQMYVEETEHLSQYLKQSLDDLGVANKTIHDFNIDKKLIEKEAIIQVKKAVIEEEEVFLLIKKASLLDEETRLENETRDHEVYLNAIG